MNYNLQDIFGITNKIPVTYVVRNHIDSKLEKAITRNKHIVIYGCSKQGKTSLRKRHLNDSNSVVVQCTNNTTREMIYRFILKNAGVELSNTKSNTTTGNKKLAVSVSGEGNVLLAKVKGGSDIEIEKTESSETLKKYFEIDPSDANDIIRILSNIDYSKWIIIEDFHYLSDEVQKYISADLKAFYEKNNNIRFIIIGVWLDAGKLSKLNGDLDGRIDYINADIWSKEYLIKVLEKGEKALNIKFSLIVKEKLMFFCRNNVGLLQQIAEYVCDNIGITKTQTNTLSIYDISEKRKIENSVYEKKVSNKNFYNIDKWLIELANEKSFRYTSFLREFANGPKSFSGNTFRWITYAIIKSSNTDLSNGLSIKKIYDISKQVFDKKTLKGNYSVHNHDYRSALQYVRKFHHDLQTYPPILDYDASEDILRVVDSGFLLYHSTKSIQQMLSIIGLDSNYE